MLLLSPGISGQQIFIDKHGDAEVDLTLLDTRWEYSSKSRTRLSPAACSINHSRAPGFQLSVVKPNAKY